MTAFRFLTAGESHGKGLTSIVEGVPAGLPLTEDQIAADLARRQGGYGRGRRQQIEKDRAEITAGVRHGLATGAPIALWVVNADHQNANWQVRMSVGPVDEEVERVTLLRPGHADLAGTQKYGFDDVRPILERSSARETTQRVAVGAIARAVLAEIGIEIHSHSLEIGDVVAHVPDRIDWAAVEASPVRVADPAAEPRMIAAIDAAKENLDSLGGVFEVRATGVPIGLGSHVQWDRRMDARIAQAMLSINAVKGVEIGDAFANARKPGSEVQDLILPADAWERRPWEHATNRAGGLEGGMSNGEEIVVRAALKPISTIPRRLPSTDLLTGDEATAFYERADACVVPAAGVIGEAMLAIVLAEAALEKFGGDHIEEFRRNCAAYLATVGPREREGAPR
ncbi:MAG: chorismate synthase [Dehalococcoidia bacterium]|nr:chorismate synthase [Dehalococcoidia bacterium]